LARAAGDTVDRVEKGSGEVCVEADVAVVGKMAMITTRDGKRAVVPLRILCDVAKRFGLCYRNYRC